MGEEDETNDDDDEEQEEERDGEVGTLPVPVEATAVVVAISLVVEKVGTVVVVRRRFVVGNVTSSFLMVLFDAVVNDVVVGNKDPSLPIQQERYNSLAALGPTF